jgi:hypothetical protein
MKTEAEIRKALKKFNENEKEAKETLIGLIQNNQYDEAFIVFISLTNAASHRQNIEMMLE